MQNHKQALKQYADGCFLIITSALRSADDKTLGVGWVITDVVEDSFVEIRPMNLQSVT